MFPPAKWPREVRNATRRVRAHERHNPSTVRTRVRGQPERQCARSSWSSRPPRAATVWTRSTGNQRLNRSPGGLVRRRRHCCCANQRWKHHHDRSPSPRYAQKVSSCFRAPPPPSSSWREKLLASPHDATAACCGCGARTMFGGTVEEAAAAAAAARFPPFAFPAPEPTTASSIPVYVGIFTCIWLRSDPRERHVSAQWIAPLARRAAGSGRSSKAGEHPAPFAPGSGPCG